MCEEWIKWNHSDVPKGNYELVKLEQNWQGVTIVLEDEINRIIVFFEVMLALRSCDESERWKTISEILAVEKDFLINWPMYKGKRTELKKWFTAETFESWKAEEYEHYIFATANDVIDILSQVEPRVTVEKIV
jgi:hypothetical protein